MEEEKTVKTENEKLSYEDLEKVAQSLSMENKNLVKQVEVLRNTSQELYIHNLFKRLDYLFKVLENSISFDQDWVDKCAEEIRTIMTPERVTEDEVEDK